MWKVSQKVKNIAAVMGIKLVSEDEAREDLTISFFDTQAYGCYWAELDRIMVNSRTCEYSQDMVALHELIHATGHPKRLGRVVAQLAMGRRYATEGQAHTEEAIAQMGMVILGRYLGLPQAELDIALASYLVTLPKADLGEADFAARRAAKYVINLLESQDSGHDAQLQQLLQNAA